MKGSALIIAVLIAGVITAILGSIPLVNCLFCIWIFVGGLISVPLYQAFDKPARTLSSGQGVLLGVITGVVAAILVTIVSSIVGQATLNQIINFVNSNPDLQSLLGDISPSVQQAGFSLFSLFCNLIFYVVGGLLGGLLGAAIFKKS